MSTQRGGVLSGVRILEVAGLGPGPFASMILSDMGADVIRIDRPQPPEAADYNQDERSNLVNRGRASIPLDLKSDAGRTTFRAMCERADALVEGFRPGVMERLGFGPEDVAALNPRLVYVRVTGWGQSGPRAMTAGHDINYIALTGLLGLLGRAGEAPPVPLNLLGDYAGGGLMAVIGLLGALLERHASGLGQTVDVAIVDGAANLMAFVRGRHDVGAWQPRGQNFLDGGAPYYNVYETADGKHVAFGAIEDAFFKTFCERAGVDLAEFAGRRDPANWEAHKCRLAEIIHGRTRDEWAALLDGSDACVTPILDLNESLGESHLAGRATVTNVDGLDQPAPAPRFSRTPSSIAGPPAIFGVGAEAALERWGVR